MIHDPSAATAAAVAVGRLKRVQNPRVWVTVVAGGGEREAREGVGPRRSLGQEYTSAAQVEGEAVGRVKPVGEELRLEPGALAPVLLGLPVDLHVGVAGLYLVEHSG